MTVVLMVAEKPSLAESLAKILSNGRYKTKKGSIGPCSVHEYAGKFRGKEALFKFTSVCGHVMSVDFTGNYNNWDKVEPRELFSAPIVKKEANPSLHILNFLRAESRRAQYLVLWLDCDKEGENICFEIIQAVHTVMKISFDNPQTVFRAKFSAITEKDIKYAMENLTLPNKWESLSVDARQEADLRIGCAFTRFQTRYFHEKYSNLDSALVSFGPCQTPTLGFCVDRHDKIQSFQPEPYWVLAVSLLSQNDVPFNIEWEREREFNNNTAKSYLGKVKANRKAKVIEISKKDCTRARPYALNTVEFLRSASAGLGIGPHQAMQIAERLYTQGYISYPRTETTNYPFNFDLTGTLSLLKSNQEWGSIVSDLLKEGIKKPRAGRDLGDHPPITPMKSGSRNEFLDKDAWKVYDFIARHFIGTLCGDLKYEKTIVKYAIGNEKFSKSFDVVINQGFTRIMNWLEMTSSHQLLSDIKVGDEYTIAEAKLSERHTCPPDYLTEADLISLMEKHGIGTDASIPTHINNICLRNYVKVSSGRKLVPTKLGIVLVHGYQRIDKSLVLPTSRASVEKKLNLIVERKVSYEQVLKDTLDDFLKKFDNFSQNIQAMDELFEVSFSSLADSGKPLSRCGKCLRYLKIITARPQRLYCQNCNETFSLPANGSLRTFKELKCPLDNFELLYFTGHKGKSFLLCPNCYNNPSFEDMPKHSGCGSCLNSECKQSKASVGITDCKECHKRGTLILDVGSGTNWKISCNKCDLIFNCFNGAIKVLVKNEKCEKCASKLVEVHYKKSVEQNELKGCIFCSSKMIPLVELKEKRSRFKLIKEEAANVQANLNYLNHDAKFFKQGRGRARGRGTGKGRGKGFLKRSRGPFKGDGHVRSFGEDRPKGLQLSDFF